jgi:hypothetical protein
VLDCKAEQQRRVREHLDTAERAEPTRHRRYLARNRNPRRRATKENQMTRPATTTKRFRTVRLDDGFLYRVYTDGHVTGQVLRDGRRYSDVVNARTAREARDAAKQQNQR